MIGWQNKKKKYDNLFHKKIEDYKSYESIKNLFSLKNSISHGETHLEIERREIATGIKSTIQSVSDSCQNVRLFLIAKRIMEETEIASNAKVLWTLNIARFFFRETQLFLTSVIMENESSNKMGVQAEFQTVISNNY